jgi:hypothetical protein
LGRRRLDTNLNAGPKDRVDRVRHRAARPGRAPSGALLGSELLLRDAEIHSHSGARLGRLRLGHLGHRREILARLNERPELYIGLLDLRVARPHGVDVGADLGAGGLGYVAEGAHPGARGGREDH